MFSIYQNSFSKLIAAAAGLVAFATRFTPKTRHSSAWASMSALCRKRTSTVTHWEQGRPVHPLKFPSTLWHGPAAASVI
jgi:hypothetical protein